MLRQWSAGFPWRRRFSRSFWGNATEAVFSIVLLCLGLVVLIWCLVGLWQSWNQMTFGVFGQVVIGVLLSSGLVVIGGFRLIRVLYENAGSQEQRSLLWQQALDREYLRPLDTVVQEFPTVPSLASHRLGTGSQLRYRLVGIRQSRSRWLGLVGFSLLMLGVSTVLGAVVWDEWPGLKLDRLILMLSCLAGLVLVTAWLLWKTGKQLVDQVQLGPTQLEISRHPLVPGEEYQVFFCQNGEIRLESLKISLECFEQSTYQQGTDCCTQQQTAYRQNIAEFHAVTLANQALQHQCEFQVPAGAMHSFAAGSNSVGWRLVVSGVKPGCQEFRREFPIIVVPASANPRLTPRPPRSA